jgi:hypothetical protein
MSLLSHSNESVVVLLDVTSGSVGASLVQLPIGRGKQASILYETRHAISDKKLDSQQLEKAMLASLMEVTLDVKRAGEPKMDRKTKVSSVFLFFGSPWRALAVLHPRMVSSQAFVPKQEDIERVIEEDAKKWLSTLRASDIWVDGKDEPDLLMEKITLSIMLNGYTAVALGTDKVFEASAVVLASVLPSRIDYTIRDIIGQAFPHAHITAHPALQAILFSLDRKAVRGNVVLIRVTETITDVSVLVDGLPVAVASFPVGQTTVVWAFANSSKEGLSSAISHLKLHLRKEEESNEAKKTEEILSKVGLVWRDGLLAALKECADVVPIPGTMLLVCGDTLFEGWFLKQIADIDMSGVAFFSNAPKVEVFCAKYMRWQVESKKGIPCDALSLAEITFSQNHL